MSKAQLYLSLFTVTAMLLPAQSSEAQLFSRFRNRNACCNPAPRCMPVRSNCCNGANVGTSYFGQSAAAFTPMSSNVGTVMQQPAMQPIMQMPYQPMMNGCGCGNNMMQPMGSTMSTGLTPTVITDNGSSGGTGGFGPSRNQDCKDEHRDCLAKCNSPACAGVTNCTAYCDCQLKICDKVPGAPSCGLRPGCLNAGTGGPGF